MPQGPREDESQNAFMRRCFQAYMAEGMSKEDAVERCNGMWYGAHPEQSRQTDNEK